MMTFETLTPKGMKIIIPDMHGKPSAELVPFAVRCPNFIELNDGTILYFFCMKFGSQKDEEIGGSVMMRSHDGGKTWGEMQFLCYDGAPCEGGIPIYDKLHDTLILIARTRHWKSGYEEDRLLAEDDQILGHTYERFWMNKSTDGGRTWGNYREITIKNTPANWTIQHCPSPGIGIQLEKQKDDRLNGRLIVPCNDASLNNGRNEFRAHLIVSDNFGESWRVAALENYLGASESVIVERGDGILVYNCRNQSGFPANRRIQSFSYDGGDTLDESATVDTLYDPLCHSGFAIAEVDGKEYIFSTSPTGALGDATDYFRTGTPQHWGVREALMLYASSDGGKTYKAIKQVCDKGVFAAYSALCVTKGGKLLCAWESGPEIGLYRDIKYATFDLSELVKLCN